MSAVLKEHLNDGKTYKQLPENLALGMIDGFKTKVHDIICYEEEGQLTDSELTFFGRGFFNSDRIPQFYGMPKIHKEEKILPWRPVTSQCGSASAIVSRYIDYYLQKYIQSIPSYTQSSINLIYDFNNLEKLPSTARMMKSDARAMYSNIDPIEGITTVEKYLREYKHETTGFIPVPLLTKLLRLVMNNNIFMFGDTYWQQLIGTAMGTPCACSYATIFFAYFERTFLLRKYNKNLLLYKRMIDDIFLIWVPTNENPFSEFVMGLNAQCKLEWKTEKLSLEVDFLDITVQLQDGRLITKTYQKPMSLHLYIPGNSAHPKSLHKSLI